ncbi:MAG: hypothetical protein JXA09_04005 [Anaerolineae bacterium]|nr:hypothetical protein [Anaerolineae bacterium]
MTQRRPIRCTATTRRGQPCRAWAVQGSDPPRCAAHGGSAPPPRVLDAGSAEAHCACSDPPDRGVDLETRIADLDRRIARLSAYIDRISPDDPDITLQDYTRLLALHGQLTSRLGRLARDQQQLQAGQNADLAEAMDEALDLAGEILGIEV